MTEVLPSLSPHNPIQPPTIPHLHQLLRHHHPPHLTMHTSPHSTLNPLTKDYYSTTLLITPMPVKRASSTAKLFATNTLSPRPTQTFTATTQNPLGQRIFPLHNHCCIQQSHFTHTKPTTPTQDTTSNEWCTPHSLYPTTKIFHKSHTFSDNSGTSYKVTTPYHNSSLANHFSHTPDKNPKDMLIHRRFSTHNKTKVSTITTNLNTTTSPQHTTSTTPPNPQTITDVN